MRFGVGAYNEFADFKYQFESYDGAQLTWILE